MQLNPSEISELIRNKIEKFDLTTEARNEGTVVSVTDGIVRVHGLADARYYEMLEFPGNTMGMVLNLEEDNVGAAILGDSEHIKEGDTVKVVVGRNEPENNAIAALAKPSMKPWVWLEQAAEWLSDAQEYVDGGQV